MHEINLILIFFLGLSAGSFLSVLIDRMPKGEDFVRTRSRCPECKERIVWYDNIPLVSYLFLGARCRSCSKPIPLFYPFVEGFMGFLFVGIYALFVKCSQTSSVFCSWNGYLESFTLPFFLVFITILAGVFIIDFRHQIIPDGLSLSLFAMSLLALIFAWPDKIYVNLFSGFAAASFLLFLHLITRGKGMGLGDVKLVIPLGMILGPLTIVWISLSFIIGAVVGIFLIVGGKTSFGKHIAFGPFLILAFMLTLFCSSSLTRILVPTLL